MKCERCGCTDERACVGADGEPCAWARDGLCDACLRPEEWAEVEALYYRTENPTPAAPLLYDAYGVPVR
jgi:hypothetical protein